MAVCAHPAKRWSFTRLTWLSGALVGSVLAATASSGLQRSSAISTFVSSNDVCITYVPGTHSVLYVWKDHIYDLSKRRSRTLPIPIGGIEYFRWNERRDKVLLGDKETALLVEYPSLRIAKVFERTISAWWEGAAVARVADNNQYTRQYLMLPSQQMALPRDLNVTATTDDGRVLLARVRDQKLPFEQGGNAVLIRRQGTRGVVRSGKLLPHNTGLAEYPYGDFVMMRPDRKAILFGLGSMTFRTKSYVRAHHHDIRTGRSAAFFNDKHDKAHYIMPPVFYGAGRFTGVYRLESHKINQPNDPLKYYRFTVRNGRLSSERLPFDVLGYATSSNGKEHAYLWQDRGGPILALFRGKKRWVRERLNANGEPLSWKPMPKGGVLASIERI